MHFFGPNQYFYYDTFNRLVREGSSGVEYFYDSQNRRVWKRTADGNETFYVYNGNSVAAEYDQHGTLLREFVEGIGIDEHLCMIDYTREYNDQGYNPNGYWYYYILDTCNGVDRVYLTLSI